MDMPDATRKVVRVNIFNQAYSVTTSSDPARTEQLALEIDELMSTIARHAGNLDSTRTAVLACLHLADKLRTTELELLALRESVEHKSQNFALLLDKAILPEPEPENPGAEPQS